MTFRGPWWGVLCVVVACGGKQQPHPEGAGGAPSDDDDASSGGGGRLPTAPAARGAALIRISSFSPSVPGKTCPSGAALTTEVPAVAEAIEKLDGHTYVHYLIDGEQGAAVSCRVSGQGTYELSGRIEQGGKAIAIENGSVSGRTGSATISLTDAVHVSGKLTAPAPCQIDVGADNLQISAGRIWARFSCASVEQAPSALCTAQGYFVLENCEQK